MWLTKLNPNFAWLVIIGGSLQYGFNRDDLHFVYQMWIMPLRTLRPNV